MAIFLDLPFWRTAIRGLGALLCNIIFNLISWIYQLFITVSRLNILSSDGVAPIYQRVTMILTIVMTFYITFEFVKYVIQPDTITDKEKGAGNILKRIIIVVVLIAFVPRLFTLAYRAQNIIIENQVISKVILGKKNVNFATFGNDFSANLLSIFYDVNESACQSGCNEEREIVKSNLDGLRQGEGLNLTQGIENSVSQSGEKIPTIRFDGILAIGVGVFILYILILYSIDVGIRYFQLLFLQIIAPIAIMGYMLPKKDNIFEKWYKQCFSTYIDLFLRLAIIYFVLMIVQVLGDAMNAGTLFAGIDDVSGSIKTFAYIVLVMGLLAFAQRAPKLLGELFPSMGSKAGIGFGLKAAERVAPGAARTLGASYSGLRSLTGSTVRNVGNEIARRRRIKDKLTEEGKPVDRRSMRKALREDRRAEREAKRNYGNRRRDLANARDNLINAERELYDAKNSGSYDKMTESERAELEAKVSSARTKFEAVRNGGDAAVSVKTKGELNLARENLARAQADGSFNTMSQAEKDKLTNALKQAQAKYNAEANSGYDQLKRQYEDARSKTAEDKTNSYGANIILQAAGAGLTGLATGVKTGAQATKIEDIGKKAKEAEKTLIDKENARMQWLESGGSATAGGSIDRLVTQLEQKWGIKTEADRIKLDVKKLEDRAKVIDAQVSMEGNLKTTQDEGKDRSFSKLEKHEQKIIFRNEDKGKLKANGQTIDIKEVTNPDGSTRNETTSEVLMRYEQQANTAKARAEAANAELVKATLEGRATDDMKTEVERLSKEAEQKKFMKEQVHKKLAEYGVTRTLQGDTSDGVLVNKILSMRQAIDNARNNPLTVQYVEEQLRKKFTNSSGVLDTVEYNKHLSAFMNNNFEDYDTFDTIQSITTTHTGELKNAKSELTETIRAINESSATAAANANAASGGKK